MELDDAEHKADDDAHGTACAGVACAKGVDSPGVAPMAKLMPIRLRSGLGSMSEANAFVWAADHGADVISCSWGPTDGDWWNPTDKNHKQVVALPDSSRLAMEYAMTKGRGGKGCVILFAAGNGNEKADNDGYASNPAIIAVAACNDRGKRSVYSDFGKNIWVAFRPATLNTSRSSTLRRFPRVSERSTGSLQRATKRAITPTPWWNFERMPGRGGRGRADVGDQSGAFADRCEGCFETKLPPHRRDRWPI